MSTSTLSPPEATTSPVPIPRRLPLTNPLPQLAPGDCVRELLATFVCVALWDVAVCCGHGFAGYAAVLVGSPLLLAIGSGRRPSGVAGTLVSLLLLTAAARLAWLGSGFVVTCGLALIFAFVLTLARQTPYVTTTLGLVRILLVLGFDGLRQYRHSVPQLRLGRPPGGWGGIGLPILACGLFSGLFLLANPDLLAPVRAALTSVFEYVGDWLTWWSPTPQRAIVWLVLGWCCVGLLRSVRPRPNECRAADVSPGTAAMASPKASSPWYEAFRNTLVAVSVLFAAYLVFEFRTLWFRTFPPGFYYPGYAHEGAAWLTVALGLATVTLSVIFRGPMLDDARLPKLRRLAWVWSVENLLLAVSVYHRLFLYIDFNGQTRMRMVGLFGITAVLAGFGLVVVKIVRQRSFPWLIQRQLWALALTVYAFAVLPIDAIVVGYNVRCILAGDLAPSMQLGAHPIDTNGYLMLPPLLDCPDETIREGVRALLAERLTDLSTNRAERDWTAWQLADVRLRRRLESHRAGLSRYLESHEQRGNAIDRFRKYTFQWY